MLNADLWEVVNGVLGILGSFIVVLVIIYLLRNIRKTYHEPIRFITLSFALIVLGHTIKDSAAYLSRCCAVATPNEVVVAALLIVAVGKLGCIKIWSDPKWGHWPWVAALVLVIAFLLAHALA